jgi:hypothetical protein
MLTGEAAGYEPQFITPVIQPRYRELPWLLFAAGIVRRRRRRMRYLGGPAACSGRQHTRGTVRRPPTQWRMRLALPQDPVALMAAFWVVLLA